MGIVGCGGIAGLHAKGYQQCKDVTIVACSDLDKARAQTFAATHNIPGVYDDYKKLLETEKLDAISVCTPNYAHCAPTVVALAAGVNVMCEKPIAMNAAEALEMVKAAKKYRRLLTIGHHMRFYHVSQHLKKLIEAGDLGDIYFGRSWALRRRWVPGWGAFHIKKKSGGGPLIDIGVHALDLIVWLMGSPKPESVSGSVYTKLANQPEFFTPWGNNYKREEYDVEDFACGMVKFSGGASLLLEASWAAHIPEQETQAQLLLGDKAGARINPGNSAAPLSIYSSGGEAISDRNFAGFPETEPHIAEIAHWVACLRGEKQVLVKPEESLNIQRIIDSLYLSSKRKREVRFSEEFKK